MAQQLEFERLVDTYYAPLYRFALSLTRQESDACDLTQQTFYIWAAKGHQLKDTAKVKSWLFTTLHREYLRLYRDRTRYTPIEWSEVEDELPEVPPPADGLDARSAVEALSRIDPAFRAAVALFYLEDYTYPEIAHILDIPLGTVKSRIARGIAQLQKSFNKLKGRQVPEQRHD